MNERALALKEWERFAKGKAYKDGPLVKALAAAERAGEGDPAAWLERLGDVEEAAKGLLKAHKGDKALAEQIEPMLAALKPLRKEAERRAAEGEDGDGEEGQGAQALLTEKLVPLLRQVRQGETLHALIGLESKQAVVLLARRPIAPARRELLKQWLDASSGVKFLPGQCVFEAEAHTFVVPGASGGLAKRLKAALLAQTGLRLKVRVRGEDPNDVDEDLDDAGAPPQAGGTPPDVDPALAFNARLAALSAALKPALLAGGEASQTLKRTVSEAGALARQKAFDDAHRLLDEVERLLAAPVSPAAVASAAPRAPAAPAATAPRLEPKVAFMQARLAWDQMRKRLQAELRKVEAAVLARVGGESDFATIAANLRELHTLLEDLDERLIDTLDDALNATTAEARATFHVEAREIVAEYLDFVATDDLLAAVDRNGFVGTSLVPELQRCLAGIDTQLRGALAA